MPLTDTLHREILPNGVTLLVQRADVAPAASLVAHVRAGFLDEPDDLVGVSHVVEHMLFKGTPSLGPGQLAQRAKSLGAHINAYTAYDRTVYYMTAPVRTLPELIRLQADQVRNSVIDAEELRRELGVIVQEARRKLDSPGAVVSERLHQLLFQQHRIRRWRIGTEAELERFTRDDVFGYYASRYVPSRTIVSVVAAMEPSQMLDLLRQAWDGWSAAAVEHDTGPTETTAPRSATIQLHGDVAMTDLALGWRAPGILDDRAAGFDVAATLLTTGSASRLARALREPGIVHGIGASHYGVVNAGVFAVGADLLPVRLTEALNQVGAAFRDLADRPADQLEFERARAMLRAHFRRSLEHYERRAIAFAANEALGDVTRLDREEQERDAVTADQVRDLIHDWCAPDLVCAVAYSPDSSSPVLDDGLLRDAFSGRHAIAPMRPPPVDPASAATDLLSQRHSQHNVRLPRIHHLALPGIDILAARFGSNGQVSLTTLWRPPMSEHAGNAGVGALTMRGMIRGTERRDASALSFAMEMLGGGIRMSAGPDVHSIGCTVLAEHGVNAMRLLEDVRITPRLDAEGIEIERQLLLTRADAVADDMVRCPIQLAFGAAFGDRGYGAPALGTRASLEQLDAESVRQCHRAMRAQPVTVIAVGDIDPERFIQSIAASVREPAATTALVAAPSGSPHPGLRSERRTRQQSAIAMIFPGPSRQDPARFAADIWSSIAGGLGGRLFESLRSQRSLAYTVMAYGWQPRHAGALLTYIAMQPERLDEARAAMLEELARFRDAPPSDDEMERAIAFRVGGIEVSRQTAGEFAHEIADAWMVGSGLEELTDPAAPYRSVTSDEVHLLAQRSFASEPAIGIVEAK